MLGAKVSKKEIVLPVRLQDGTVLDLILWTVGAGALKGRGRAFAARAVGIFAVCGATRHDSLGLPGGFHSDRLRPFGRDPPGRRRAQLGPRSPPRGAG